MEKNEITKRVCHTFEEAPNDNQFQKLERLLNYCKQVIKEYQKNKGFFGKLPRILLFTGKSIRANGIAFYLNSCDLPTLSFTNWTRDENYRSKVLELFREGTIPIIIIADKEIPDLEPIAATYIINVDLPKKAETYAQRVRLAASESPCYAHSFVDPSIDKQILFDLGDIFGRNEMSTEESESDA